MAGHLAGKNIAVTGAGNGIGRGIALACAAAGANVVVASRNQENISKIADAINQKGQSALAIAVDITNEDQVDSLIEQTVAAFGSVDIIVNNAGLLRDAMSFSMTEDQWDLVVDVHLKGHAATAHHASRYWRATAKSLPEGAALRPRRIINTTSESGLFGGPAQLNYGSAKGGIVTMTLILAKELGRYGVTANCIAPRARTQMNESIDRFKKPETGFDSYHPAHVSPMVAWLASDAASDVNGQTFIVTGDEIHRMAIPTVAGAITAGDQPWTVDSISANKSQLFGSDSPTIPPWAGPPMR